MFEIKFIAISLSHAVNQQNKRKQMKKKYLEVFNVIKFALFWWYVQTPIEKEDDLKN